MKGKTIFIKFRGLNQKIKKKITTGVKIISFMYQD